MPETIAIGDRYRLRRLDKWNMILEEWREPKVAETVAGNAVCSGPRWYAMSGGSGTGPFFGKVGDALVWLLDWRMRNDPGETKTLAETVEAYRKIAYELKAAVAS